MEIRKVYKNKACPVGFKSFKPVKLVSAINKFLLVPIRSQCFFLGHILFVGEKMPGIHVISKECQ